MKTYLITGGAGFFGSILKKIILEQGNACVSIDLEPDDYKNDNFIAIQGDIRDKVLLDNVFSKYKFNAIFHCAALLAHEKKHLKDLWSSNVDGTKNIAEYAKKYNVKQIVFTSSNCIWCKKFDYPVTEQEIPEPAEIYGQSKVEGEKILLSYSDSINSVIFRCPTIIDEGRLGLLGIFFQFIDENRKLWMVGDGENRYQFIYAKDLAEACIKAADYPQTEIFNIGSDNVKTLNEVYQYVITKAGSKSKLVHTPKKFMQFCMKLAHRLGVSPLGPYHYKMISESFIFDTTKIKEKLNFIPSLTNEEMLYKAYKYYHDNKCKIFNRTNVSSHKSIATMGIIRIVKFFS